MVFIAWLPVSRLWITSAKRRKAQQPLSLSVPALRGAVLPQLELTQLAQSACKKFYRAKPLSIFGCPPNPHNFLATVAHIITYGKPPKLDDKNRPTFAYGRLIHEHCERRPHFDAGRFAKEFGDEGHREGWCLYHLGCKGPETYGNCSTLQFCDVGGVWPVAIGHPCYGCNEEGIGFHKGIHQLANVENQTPRSQKPDVNAKEGGNVSAGAIGLLGGVVGLVAGVSVMAVRELGRQQKKDNADSRGE